MPWMGSSRLSCEARDASLELVERHDVLSLSKWSISDYAMVYLNKPSRSNSSLIILTYVSGQSP
jgi:hypothetical protein